MAIGLVRLTMFLCSGAREVVSRVTIESECCILYNGRIRRIYAPQGHTTWYTVETTVADSARVKAGMPRMVSRRELHGVRR